jgi:hypothetical protein
MEYVNVSTNWWKYVELTLVGEEKVPVVELFSSHLSRVGEVGQQMVSGRAYWKPESTHRAVLLVTEPLVPKDWYETPGGVSPLMLPPRKVKATLT